MLSDSPGGGRGSQGLLVHQEPHGAEVDHHVRDVHADTALHRPAPHHDPRLLRHRRQGLARQ